MAVPLSTVPVDPPPTPAAAEHYVDSTTYAFSHGPEMLVVLTAGVTNATATATLGRRLAGLPASYPLTGLTNMAGTRLCDALRSGVRCPGCKGDPAFIAP